MKSSSKPSEGLGLPSFLSNLSEARAAVTALTLMVSQAVSGCTTNNYYNTPGDTNTNPDNNGVVGNDDILVESTSGDLVTGIDKDCNQLLTPDGQSTTPVDNQCGIDENASITSSVVCDTDTCIVTGGGNLLLSSADCFQAGSLASSPSDCDWEGPSQCADIHGNGVAFNPYVTAGFNQTTGRYEIEDLGGGHNEFTILKGCN